MDDAIAEVGQISTSDNNIVAEDTGEKRDKLVADIDNQSEKYDVSPENLEKSSYDITPNDDLSTSVSGMTTTANNETASSISQADDKSSQNDDKSDGKTKSTGFAFTIDFNEGKSMDNRKYKEIATHFHNRQQQQKEQRRHRRGVSLSKLDDSRKSSTSLNSMENSLSIADDSNVQSIAAKPPLKQRVKIDNVKSDEKCDTKVVLRRPRPTAAQTANCKESSKRHSWSPRSSINLDKISRDQPIDEPPKPVESGSAFQPKSTILQRAMESNSLRPSARCSVQSAAKKSINVIRAPLEYVRNSDDEGSIGDASQATYTLDGDNYTEEEKERMSIDKLGKRNFDLSIDSKSRHDMKNYPDFTNKLNYSRDMKIDSRPSQRHSIERDQLKASPKSAKSYLDKIKSRVKTIGDRTFQKTNTKQSLNEKLMNLQVVRTDDSSPVDADHGVFTSITACGVLNKGQAPKPSASRKKCLTKFQIDSSEYIQPKVDETLMNSYTDYEKAKQSEYKLKIFSTVSSYTSSGTSPIHTDDDNLSVECVDDKPISIKTAPTKNDWIQEWAKNARRRNNLLASSATASPKLQHFSKNGRTVVSNALAKEEDRMSQSYDTYFHQSEQFGDDVIEDSSDECMAGHVSRPIGRNNATPKTEFNDEKPASVLRPPISPTKIPSPMHSQFRGRSSSANRSFRSNQTVSITLFIALLFNFTALHSSHRITTTYWTRKCTWRKRQRPYHRCRKFIAKTTHPKVH